MGRVPYRLFQFHKVRLKVSGEGVLTTDKDVSIPQGTIKRTVNGTVTRRVSVVSIPQGTIKSLIGKNKTSGGYIVSIPQGTIKSELLAHKEELQKSFNSTRYD